MKHFFLVFCLLFVLANLCSQNNMQSRTNISIKNKFRDLGKVTSGTVITERYYIVNHGEKKVKILYVNPECTCTDFKVSSYSIMPRDSVFIDVTLDTTGKLGSQTIYTIIKTNTNNMYKLTIKVLVND